MESGAIYSEEQMELINNENPKKKGGDKNMTHEYNIGDTIRLKDYSNWEYPRYLNQKATIIEILDRESSYDVCIRWPNMDTSCATEDNIELVFSSVKKTMSTLKTLTKQQKADLSPENRALVELGLLEDNLVPTVKGLEYLQEFLFEQNKAELAKIAVKEVAEIRKEEKTTKGK